jgi:CBS domain-containing protein
MARGVMQKAAKLMLQYEVSGFPVVDRSKLVGIITEGDFLRRVEIGTERRRACWIEVLAGPRRLAEDTRMRMGAGSAR